MSARTGSLSVRTGRGAWALLAALATGCCATQHGEREPPPVSGPGDAEPQPGTAPAPALEFVVIDADEVRRRLWPEPAPRAYVPPDAAQAGALASLIRGMLGDPQPPLAELAAAARESGFAVEGWQIDGRRYVAAIETPTRRGGGGAYIVRVADAPGMNGVRGSLSGTASGSLSGAASGSLSGTASGSLSGTASGSATHPASGSATHATPGAAPRPVILQAPHGFYDLGTERIALDLMLADGPWPRALFVNTIHRYLGADGVKRKQAASPADPCHSEQHLLAVATAAALDALPSAEVVQLHGFGDNSDDAPNGPQPAAIVSGGKADGPTPRSREIAARLRDALGVEVALYPVDTDRLGATTNVQGRAIHARGGADFIHIEMSAALRQRLRSDAAARARLGVALRERDSAAPATGTP